MTTVHPSLAGGGEGGPVPWHPHGGDDLSGQATFLQLHVENLLAGTIDSKEIVISGGVDGVIRSDNFEAGVSGWAIFGDGSIEARSITIVADAGSEVDWSFIQNVSVATADIENASITTAKIANAAITTAKIASAAITTAKIENAAITDAKIDSLSANKLTAGIITSLRYRTATPGNARLEIRGDSQERFIRFIDAGDVTRGTMGQSTAPSGGDGMLLDIGPTSLELDDVGGIYANTPYLAPSGLTDIDGTDVPGFSFSGDPDTGLYRSASNQMTVLGGGAAQAETGNGSVPRWSVPFGSASAPGLSFIGDTDTGIYRPGPNGLVIAAGGSEQFRVSPSVVSSVGVRDNTTGSAASVFINATSGVLQRSTSARRYKSRITYNVGYLADIDLAPTKHWRPDDKQWRYSLVADDLADQDPLLGVYGEVDEIEDYDLRAVVAVLAAKVNRLEARLEAA